MRKCSLGIVKLSFCLLFSYCLLASETYTPSVENMTDDQIVRKWKANAEVVESKTTRILFLKGTLKYAEAKKLLEVVDSAQARIKAIMGRSIDKSKFGDKKISFFIVDSQTLRPHVYLSGDFRLADFPYVFLPVISIRQGFAPIFHELTHIYFFNTEFRSLREGLAEFVQFVIGPQKKLTFNEFTLDIHKKAREILARGSAVEKQIGTRIAFFSNSRQRAEFYYLSRSFVAFLIHRFGMDRFILLYEGTKSYLELYSANLADLKKAWRKEVKKQLRREHIVLDDLSTKASSPTIYHKILKIFDRLSLIESFSL